MSRSSFNFEDLVDFVDFSSFRFLLTSLSPTNNKIAIATSRYLIIVEDNSSGGSIRKSLPSSNPDISNDEEHLQTVVEFGEVSGRPTAISWISSDVVCVGFEHGGLSCFNPFGETITEIEFANCSVTAIHTFRNSDFKVSEHDVWVLFENKFIVSIPISHLLGTTGALSRYYLKFKLMDQVEVQDFIVLPDPHSMNMFDSEINSPNISFIVVGVDPSLSLYNVGGKQHFQHLGKLASYVRERVSSAISKTVSNALVSFFGSGGSSEPVEEEDYTPITSSLDFVESNKRRIMRVSLDPTGKLLATADTLGRVLLFDMRYVSTVIRVWKGVREARLAWSMDLAPGPAATSGQSGESSSAKTQQQTPVRSYQLSLAIYAPQLGLLSLYQARHGPCLRSIPVGPQCQIFTVQELSPAGEVVYKCALLRTYAGSPLLHFSVVSPFDRADDDVDLNEIHEQTEAIKNDLKDNKNMLSIGGGTINSSAQLIDLVIPPYCLLSPSFPASFDSGSGSATSLLQAAASNSSPDNSPSTVCNLSEEFFRFVSKVEKILKEPLLLLRQSQSSSSSSSSGGRVSISAPKAEDEFSDCSSVMSSVESSLWSLLASPASRALYTSSLSPARYDGEGVSLLLHCLDLIERVETTLYIKQAYAEHSYSSAATGQSSRMSSESQNGNSKNCGLLYFSLQFHKNLCHLLEEVSLSTVKNEVPTSVNGKRSSRLPLVLAQYARNRLQLITAYSMLMDINASLSLNEMIVLAAEVPPVDGYQESMSSPSVAKVNKRSTTRSSYQLSSLASNSASSDQDSLRAEAINWASRFLRCHYKAAPATQPTLASASSSSSQQSGNSSASSRSSLSSSTSLRSLPSGSTKISNANDMMDISTHHELLLDSIICDMNPLSFFQTTNNTSSTDARSHFSPLPSVPLSARAVSFNVQLASQYSLMSKLSAQSVGASPHSSSKASSSGAASITASIRCPQSPQVFQPAAVGRYLPFAVFLAFHEKDNARIRIWREHVEMLSDGASQESEEEYVHSSDSSDSGSDSESEQEEMSHNRSNKQITKQEKRKIAHLVKLSNLSFQFEAFASLMDRCTEGLNKSVWFGGEALPSSTSAATFTSSAGDNSDHVKGRQAVASGLPSWVARELLTFLCLPLLGDAFSVQSVITVFDMVGLGGSGLGLVKTLPMVVLFLEAQPVSVLFEHLINKPLQASPIQRWLRDTLLQFQTYMASDVDEEDDEIVVVQDDRGPEQMVLQDLSSGDSQQQFIRYRDKQKKKELLSLLTDVMASRAEAETELSGGRLRANSSSEKFGSPVKFSLVEDDSRGLESSTSIPSLDEVVRYLFRPAWLLARRSHHLELMFMLTAQIVEVLEVISEQLEKKTFGELNLKGINHAWCMLAKQLRVALLVSSRTGGKVSVEKLATGEISLYGLLATDTLCFAMQPEQAVEHELRCQEVYNRRAGKEETKGGSSNTGASNKSNDGNALLAWGATADARWKELISIADTEDSVLQETAVSTSLTSAAAFLVTELHQILYNSALVLSSVSTLPSPLSHVGGPLPSSLSFSSSTSNISLLQAASSSSLNVPARTSRKSVSTTGGSSRDREKDSKKVRRRRPLLLFFPTHNQPAPLAAYRSFALADRWMKRPKRLEILHLAGAHLFSLPPVTRAAVAEHIIFTNVFPLLKEYLLVEDGERQQSVALAPKSNAGKSSVSSSSVVGGSKNQFGIQELVVVMADAELAEQLVSGCIELLNQAIQSFQVNKVTSSRPNSATKLTQSSNHNFSPSTAASTASTNAGHNGFNVMSPIDYTDEASDLNNWPPTQDIKLGTLVRNFREKSGNFEEAVRHHMALLWVLQLRTQCGLRGVKLSELYGSSLLKSFACDDSLDYPTSLTTSETACQAYSLSFSDQLVIQESYIKVVNSKAEESSFANNQLSKEDVNIRHIVHVREEFLMQCFRRLEAQPSALVYNIADIWGFEGRQMRLGHLTIMLQLGFDEVAEELISQIDDPTLVIDCITQGIRVRVGGCLACMERIQACGPLLASFDPEYYSWARESSGPPDLTMLDGILKGKLKVVPFDVPTSRHLLIRVQALLLLVPQHQRVGKWKQRKSQCDALLALCSSLSPTEIQGALKHTGLKLQ